MRGVMAMAMSSWNNSLHAYGIVTWLMSWWRPPFWQCEHLKVRFCRSATAIMPQVEQNNPVAVSGAWDTLADGGLPALPDFLCFGSYRKKQTVSLSLS